MALYQPSDAFSDKRANTKRQNARGVARQARRVESSIPISGDPRPLGSPRSVPYGIAAIPAIVTTAIPAASGTTVGTGAAQKYYLASVDSNAVTADPDSDGTVTVLNWYENSGTIATGTHVFIGWWSNAFWYLGGDC